MPNRMGRAALVLAGIAGALVLLEAGLRLLSAGGRAGDLRGLHEPRPDRPWLYGLRPGVVARLPVSGSISYEINADGFRGPLHARPKPAGTFRVVVLGDSLAFGYGVAEADTFPRRLEERLRAVAPDRRIEVVNLGVGGYNPYTEEQLLADVGLTYEPDLVVVQFCINDLNDPTLHFDAQTLLRLGTLPPEAFPDPAARTTLAIADTPFPAWCRASEVCARLEAAWARFLRRAPDAAALGRALEARDAAAGPEWQWLRERYRGIARLAAGAGAPVAVAVFPHRDQVDRAAANPVAQRLRQWGAEDGWKTVDLLPTLAGMARKGEPTFLDAWHPTAAAHHAAAESLARALVCARLVPVAGAPAPDCPTDDHARVPAEGATRRC